MENRNELLAAAALRIDESAGNQNIPARMLGGMAIYMHSICTRNPPFSREINDLDFLVSRKKSSEFGKLLVSLGYTADKQFNSIHGETRMLFYSDQTEVDVFVGQFIQCHELDLEKHISESRFAIPLAYLLLTKLQIVQINKKDLLDIIALLHDHEVKAKGGEECVNLDSITELTGNDWGWHTTVGDNLEHVTAFIGETFEGGEKKALQDKIALIQEAMLNAPKSIKWKLREKIGRRVKWYDMPEEKEL